MGYPNQMYLPPSEWKPPRGQTSVNTEKTYLQWQETQNKDEEKRSQTGQVQHSSQLCECLIGQFQLSNVTVQRVRLCRSYLSLCDRNLRYCLEKINSTLKNCSFTPFLLPEHVFHHTSFVPNSSICQWIAIQIHLNKQQHQETSYVVFHSLHGLCPVILFMLLYLYG